MRPSLNGKKKFKALAGEKEDLEKLAATPIEKIDPEYRSDFEALQKQIKEYVDSGANYFLIQNYCMKFKPYVGGKRTDLNGHEIHGTYALVRN